FINTDASILIFFFSSRRRHTRSKRDWSSDVCSSDLADYTFDISVDELYDALRAIEIAGRLNKATDLMQVQVIDDFIRFKTDGKKIGRASCRERVYVLRADVIVQ